MAGMRYRLRTLLILMAVAPPLGSIVYFQVVSHMKWQHRLEGPWIRQAKFLGNRAFSDKKLAKVTGVGKSVRLNAYTAWESRRKIEELYHTGGFPKATVSIFEGDKPGDKNLVFVINEGNVERISSVAFQGNSIATESRLKSLIQFQFGKVDRTKIDGDVQTLTDYYRSLGYIQTRVNRTLDYDESSKSLKLKFIIDEGRLDTAARH